MESQDAEPTQPTLGEQLPAPFTSLGSFSRYMEHLPAAFAVTRGEQHLLVYANTALRKLLTLDGALTLGTPIGSAFATLDANVLTPILDRALRTGLVARNRSIESVDDGTQLLRCTVWPDVTSTGETDHLLLEMRAATPGEVNLALQRQVAERLLLSALREHDAAALAHASWRGAAYLALESRRLTASLDEVVTLSAINRMALPHLGAWCIVDTFDEEDTMHRLAVIHPDPTKQEILQNLEGRWIPEPDDPFGLPAALRNGNSVVVVEDAEADLRNTSKDPFIIGALRALGIGSLLTVPLIIGERLIGAVTFVGDRHSRHITAEDIELAKGLANQSAMALERARIYGDAIALKKRAESASEAKSAFLGMMSHELRTPLNAIGGYVDLIDMELRGPVTAEQHADLARIRTNQQYLMVLINDLLNLTAIGSGRVDYALADVRVSDVLAKCVKMLEPLIAKKRLVFEGTACDLAAVAWADQERVQQIVVNLLSNSIKFTHPGGRIRLDAEVKTDGVELRVTDTGIGIPADKLESIFDPFVQIRSELTGADKGVGLGLGISRQLARAMLGELTVESTLGTGSTFTLTLPRGHDLPVSR